MEQAGIPKEGGPIGQMLHEHEQGRAFIRGMKQALGGENVDAGAFRTNASGYIELLRAHIEKENEILFPMGDRFLPPEKQQELLEAFDKHEEEVIGAGVHERLHAMLDDFASRY
jgi:hemerythrin-like domain-containing protein